MAKTQPNNKFYQVKKTINDVEYTAQFQGLSMNMRAVDSSYIDNSRNTSSEKLSQFLLDNIIVDPKGLQIDDFNSMEELNEVIDFARKVMEGSFRDQAIQGTDK